jgi:hypothetical protein
MDLPQELLITSFINKDKDEKDFIKQAICGQTFTCFLTCMKN